MATVQRRVIQAGVLAVVALAFGAEVSYVASTSTSLFPLPWYSAVIAIVPGLAFVFAGLIGWSLRPQNRVGLLMMGVGVGLLSGDSALINAAMHVWYPFTIVLAVGLSTVTALWAVVLIHLLLVFPSGRLVSRLDRIVVQSFYAVVPIVALLSSVAFIVVAGPWQSHSITEPPINAVYMDAVFAVGGYIYFSCLLIGTGLVIRRWFIAGRARRRSLSPLFWPMVPIAFLSLLSTGMIVGAGHLSPPVVVSVLTGISPWFLVALPVGFLIGLLRSGLDMSSVGDLVVKLSGGLAPEQLQPALAQSLHDPSLQVAYWLPDKGWFADLEGSRVELPTSDSERAASVMGDPDGPVAALLYDSSLVHEVQLVDTAAAAVRMALENARLQVQLRAQLEEMRQSRARLVEAADIERQRVERDLHDGAQQQLVTLLLSLQATKAEALRHNDPETARQVDANLVELKQALDELRELAHGIHPTILTQAGLVPAIRSLTERCPIPIDVRGDLGEVRLAQPLEATLYFVVSEAITNAVKHSKARRMCVSLERHAGLAAIDVADDGVGGADLSRGSGLRGLSDRVAAVGGRLVVNSDRQSGTTIHAEVPCG
jgi:signal transduction histidine kinase